MRRKCSQAQVYATTVFVWASASKLRVVKLKHDTVIMTLQLASATSRSI